MQRDRRARTIISGTRIDDPGRVTLRGKRGMRALQAWAATGASYSSLDRDFRRKVQKRHAQALETAGINPNLDEIVVNLSLPYREKRFLSMNVGPAGAYTVAEDFSDTFERALVRYSPVREIADVIGTDTGADYPYPTANDVTNEGGLVVENTVIPSNVDPVFGQLVMKAFKFTSKIVLAPVELLEDAAEGFASFLADILGQRIAMAQNRQFTLGDGTGGPLGLTFSATKGLTAAGPTAITFDDLLNLYHSVDPVYRMPGMRPFFMMHDTILQTLHELKDGTNNRYLSWAGIDAANPWTFLGIPIITNLHMANTIASGNKTVLFGAASKVKIRDVRELRLKRLTERYADTDQVGFVAYFRSDSNLLNAGTGPVKYLQH